MLSNSRRRCLLAAALLFIPAAVPAQDPSPGLLDEERLEVVDLELQGVRSVEEDELRRAISTDQSHCLGLLYRITICPFYKGSAVYEREYLDPVEFRRDVLRIKLFYYQRGFRETQVDTAIARAGAGKVRVAFFVTEGPPTRIDTVVVQRPPGIRPRRARRLLGIRRGDPLDLLRIDSAVVRIRTALAGRGFGDAEVGSRVSVDDSARRAVVAIEVTPNRRTTIDTIVVRGNDRISDETIRNSLLFEERDLFKVTEMTESQRALYESGLFRRVTIAPRPPTDTTRAQVDSSKTVIVTVQEAPPRAARLSAGFNTFEFFQVGGRFTDYNLLGGARRLDVQGAVGNLGSEQLNERFIFKNPELADTDEAKYFAPTYQASLDVTQRWFGGPRNTISAGVFAQRRSSPLVFVDESFGATATFTRELTTRTPLSANYRFEVSGVEAGDVYFCVNFGVCERPTINALNRRQRLSPFTLTATADRSNDLFSPSRGSRLRFGAEHASAFTLSDFRYNRLNAEGSYYRPTLGGVVATRVRLGWVRALGSTNEATGFGTEDDVALLHPRKRFYAGGSQSVRGYGEGQLGPRVLTIPNAVLRGRRIVGTDTIYGYCQPAVPIEACNPRAGATTIGDQEFPGLDDYDFVPRPVGGTTLAEGNVEYRRPLVRRYRLDVAVFVDGALVGSSFTDLAKATGAITPGVGVRYHSPVGPIRFDVGINPSVSDELLVITETDPGAPRGLVPLQGTVDAAGNPIVHNTREFAPYRRGAGVSRALGRLALHLSIGEAF